MIDFYLDPDLSHLWLTLDAHQFEPEWIKKIFLSRLLLCTAMRLQEAISIRIADCLTNYIVIRNGKGGKQREAEFFPFFRPYYRWYISMQACRETEFLFPRVRWGSLHNHHLAPRTAREWWGHVIQLAGIRYISPHGARRTFATWSAEILSIIDLQDQLGHSRYATTEQYYRGSIPGRRFEKPKPQWIEIAEAGAEKMEALLNPQKNSPNKIQALQN